MIKELESLSTKSAAVLTSFSVSNNNQIPERSAPIRGLLVPTHHVFPLLHTNHPFYSHNTLLFPEYIDFPATRPLFSRVQLFTTIWSHFTFLHLWLIQRLRTPQIIRCRMAVRLVSRFSFCDRTRILYILKKQLFALK